MAITFAPDAPKDTLDKLDAWYPEISRLAAGMGLDKAFDLELSDGYEVKYLSVDQILAGTILDSAESRSWRHLVSSGDLVLGEIELDNENAPVVFHTGRGKDGLHRALEIAESLEGDYTACALIAPPVRFVALWLHSEMQDLIVPYPPNATPLEDFRPVSEEEAIAVLRPLARQIMARSGEDDAAVG